MISMIGVIPDPAAKPTWMRACSGAYAMPKRPVGVMTSSSSRFELLERPVSGAAIDLFHGDAQFAIIRLEQIEDRDRHAPAMHPSWPQRQILAQRKRVILFEIFRNGERHRHHMEVSRHGVHRPRDDGIWGWDIGARPEVTLEIIERLAARALSPAHTGRRAQWASTLPVTEQPALQAGHLLFAEQCAAATAGLLTARRRNL